MRIVFGVSALSGVLMTAAAVAAVGCMIYNLYRSWRYGDWDKSDDVDHLTELLWYCVILFLIVALAAGFGGLIIAAVFDLF